MDNKNKQDFDEFTEKVMTGAKLAFRRLVERSRINDDYLVFSINGKVEKVKARSIKLESDPDNIQK